MTLSPTNTTTKEATRDTGSHKITTLDQLHTYLYQALRLEHATIPPYLTALYSLHPESNSDATHIIRVVAVEEMLHLTLVANLMNAVCATPDLTKEDFVPSYPIHLLDGRMDVCVDLQPFSKDAVETFLKIERPAQAPFEEARIVDRPLLAADEPGEFLITVPGEPGKQFYSIGEFYEEIARGVKYLYKKMGHSLFVGDYRRQVTREYFYSGGGEVIPVTGLGSALKALTLIAEQGEGFGGEIYDREKELGHFYRFQQLKLERYYKKNDSPDHPSGPPLTIAWDAVYPVKKNPKLADYAKEESRELYAAATEFNESYVGFLAMITRAFNGQPELLRNTVWEMFRVRESMTRLIRNPIPGQPGVHAGPTFEPAGMWPRAAS